MKVHFCTKKIQKMGRVALTEQLLKNAGLREGDAVEIYFDVTTKSIILERQSDATSASDALTARGDSKQSRRKQ